MSIDSSSIGARCAYCRTPWTQEDSVQCPSCATTSHRECWAENGGCPILGCPSAPRDEVVPANGANVGWGAPAAPPARPVPMAPAQGAGMPVPWSVSPSPVSPSPPSPPSPSPPIAHVAQRPWEAPNPGLSASPQPGGHAAGSTASGDPGGSTRAGEPWWREVASDRQEPSWSGPSDQQNPLQPTAATMPTSDQPRPKTDPSTTQQRAEVPRHVDGPRPVEIPRRADPTPGAGWFPDPQSPGLLRWWDGQQWTEHTQNGQLQQF